MDVVEIGYNMEPISVTTLRTQAIKLTYSGVYIHKWRALRIYEQILRQHDQFFEDVFEYGYLFYKMHYMNIAVSWLEQAYRLNSSDEFLNVALGVCYYSLGNLHSAKFHFEQAMSLIITPAIK